MLHVRRAGRAGAEIVLTESTTHPGAYTSAFLRKNGKGAKKARASTSGAGGSAVPAACPTNMAPLRQSRTVSCPSFILNEKERMAVATWSSVVP